MGRGRYSKAECFGYNPDVFFEFGSGRNNKAKVQKAKKICDRCPIERECLQDNISAQYGVFGGTTPLERWKIIGMPGNPSMASLNYRQYEILFSRTPEGARMRKRIGARILARL